MLKLYQVKCSSTSSILAFPTQQCPYNSLINGRYLLLFLDHLKFALLTKCTKNWLGVTCSTRVAVFIIQTYSFPLTLPATRFALDIISDICAKNVISSSHSWQVMKHYGTLIYHLLYLFTIPVYYTFLLYLLLLTTIVIGFIFAKP